MVKHLLLCLVCGVVLAVTAGAVGAENPCSDDIVGYCSEEAQGKGGIVKCLQKNESQLSSKCRAYLGRVTPLLKEAEPACEDYILEYCGYVQPGRVTHCLMANQSRLPLTCRLTLEKRRR